MRVLFLSPRLCLPLLTGARIREYYLARALACRADVTYVSFIQPGFPEPDAAELSFFSEVFLVPLLGRYSLKKIVRGLAGSQPLSVLNYTTDEMKSVVTAIAARSRFDLVHLDSCHMVEYVGLIETLWQSPARTVYDWHNIESELMRRFAAKVDSLPKKLYANLTAKRLARLEKRILGSGFGHVVCSAREKENLRAIAPAARIAVIENGVDTERFAPVAEDSPRRSLVYVGAMDFHANIDAACWFTRHAWPAIHQRFPDWRLTLIGSNPAPAVRELAREPNVEVTGTVPDVVPYYRDAVAAIVPLRTGGGTRLKILEAMAAGVPVVSSRQGAEGLAVSPGRDIEVLDDDNGWLPALTAIATEPGLWNARSLAGLALVRAHYDWRLLGERLYEEYRSWLASAAV
ncbi:MAG TPA: glycosyltransferase [Bryobacteraceae bacterium]|jgi:sugar transferase (PEP-CTERM/EpsH1 system associated)